MDWLETLLRPLQVSSCFYGIYSTLFWFTKFSAKLPLWKKGRHDIEKSQKKNDSQGAGKCIYFAIFRISQRFMKIHFFILATVLYGNMKQK